MKSNHEIAELCKKHRQISERALDDQYQNTDKCYAYYNNDIDHYKDAIEFEDNAGNKRRALVNFGKIQENIDAVAGFMAQNRRQAKFTARLNADQKQQLYSKNMNAIYDYHRESQNAEQVETEIDFDMLITGVGATETDLSYIVGRSTSVPNGEIVKRRLPSFYWDPKARGKNLLDARWKGYADEYELKDALSLFQKSKKEDFEPVDPDEDESGYQYNPYGGLYDRIKALDSVDWSAKEEEMVRVYNHQWFEYETFYKADNPAYLVDDPLDAIYMKGRLDALFKEYEDKEGPENISVRDMFDFDPTSQVIFFDDALKPALLAEFKDLIRPIAFTRKCYYTAVVSGDHVFAAFKSISQQGFSIKCKTGYFDETHKIWVGMVNSMMDPAEYYAKALTELLFALAASSKGGVIIEDDAVEDIEEFSEEYAKTDGVAVVRSGSLAAGKIQDKARPAVPTGLETILTLADQNISSNGVPAAFMGNVEREDQSGIFFKRRIRQVISKLARYFDSLTLYQKEDARLHADLIPVWVENNNGEWVRITGADGSDQFIQISEDMLAPQYDVSIQEASQTPEDKAETAQMLGIYGDKLMPVNPAAGMQFYAESLQLTPLDGDVRNRLIKLLQPQDALTPEQVAAMQQQLQQAQAAVQHLTSQLTQAEAAKVEAQAQHSQSSAALNAEKLRGEQAKTALTLEQASRQHLENHIIQTGDYSTPNVTI